MFELKRVGKAKSESLYVYKKVKVEDGERETKNNNKTSKQTKKKETH